MTEFLDISKCAVCDLSLPSAALTHRHYGAESVCQSCAAFFRHAVCKGRAYACEKPKQCEFFKNTPSLLRTACRSCRFQKCRRVGMREELVRSLPYHLLKRSQQHQHHGQQDEIERISGEAKMAEKNSSRSPDVGYIMCVICGQLTNHRHYNAATCLACRSFFKRSALTLKEYKCLEGDGKCFMNKKGAACRACRMDKCILAGMDVSAMRLSDPSYKLHINAFLDKRRYVLRMLTNDQNVGNENGTMEITEVSPSSSGVLAIPSPNSSPELLDKILLESNYMIGSLTAVEQLTRTFFTVERSFKPGFLEQFPSLKEMLNFGENILCNFEKFTDHGPDLSNDEKYVMAAKFGNLYTRPKHLMMELCSTVEIFRSMPIYWMLRPDDQVILLNYVAMPQLELFNKFHSVRQNSPVVVKLATGCDLWRIFGSAEGRYAGDRTIQKMADYIFRLAMEPFLRVQLTTEEFVLLRAILFCHPATSGLSAHARQVLQREGERYACALMRLLQARLGPSACARRFADCMHLAECVFRSADKLREFFTYLAMVTDQHRFHASIPPVFVPMCLTGRAEERE